MGFTDLARWVRPSFSPRRRQDDHGRDLNSISIHEHVGFLHHVLRVNDSVEDYSQSLGKTIAIVGQTPPQSWGVASAPPGSKAAGSPAVLRIENGRRRRRPALTSRRVGVEHHECGLALRQRNRDGALDSTQSGGQAVASVEPIRHFGKVALRVLGLSTPRRLS